MLQVARSLLIFENGSYILKNPISLERTKIFWLCSSFSMYEWQSCPQAPSHCKKMSTVLFQRNSTKGERNSGTYMEEEVLVEYEVQN